jgi:hypothetical protein
MSSWRSVYPGLFFIISLDCAVSKGSLQITVGFLSDTLFGNIFFHSVGCLFTLLIIPFDV